MWRIVLLLLSVLIVDFALIYCGNNPDMNMLEISRALEAREKNFSLETQHALEIARARDAEEQFKITRWSAAGIIIVTTSGFFTAGRWFERRRIQKASAKPHRESSERSV